MSLVGPTENYWKRVILLIDQWQEVVGQLGLIKASYWLGWHIIVKVNLNGCKVSIKMNIPFNILNVTVHSAGTVDANVYKANSGGGLAPFQADYGSVCCHCIYS